MNDKSDKPAPNQDAGTDAHFGCTSPVGSSILVPAAQRHPLAKEENHK